MPEKNMYECLFIMKPDLTEESVKGVIKGIVDAISSNLGEVKKEEQWGKRALAFPVRKCREGYYYKVDFQAPPASITTLRGIYKLNSDILRMMMTKR